MSVKELTMTFSGKYVKGFGDEILLDNGDGSGSWYQKSLAQQYSHDTQTDRVTIVGTDLCKIRDVRL